MSRKFGPHANAQCFLAYRATCTRSRHVFSPSCMPTDGVLLTFYSYLPRFIYLFVFGNKIVHTRSHLTQFPPSHRRGCDAKGLQRRKTPAIRNACTRSDVSCVELIKDAHPVSISCWGRVNDQMGGLLCCPRARDLPYFTWQQGRSPVGPHG